MDRKWLAAHYDKDRQSIQRPEKGRVNPTAFYLNEIASALNIPAKELLDFD